ncbi:MAG: hypothetical protein ONB15_05350 [candidate division KSB1 bacterium]|nr:hypothetical protein [candidate division KSB1 bacterium]
MQGLFQLQSARDILDKLRHDLERLKSEPLNQYAAFDFFVTARHMPEWLYPGDAHGTQRKALVQQHTLLQICEHIGDGSKHFQATAKHHKSVKNTSLEGAAFQANAFQANAFQIGQLIVTLDGQAAVDFGPTIEVTDLATKVLQFWENHPDLR